MFWWLNAEKPQSSTAMQTQVKCVGISLVPDKTAAVSFLRSFFTHCALICVSNPVAVCKLISKAISDLL